ncbi:MAG: hypothetical protein J7M40_12390 [Planctomycetes bacterium]|nr:hypothetical protein [Planctomycetota bacterium]
MAAKLRNPLAQALGVVLQSTRDKMGGISSSDIATSLGLAASHYRMVEAGSAVLQPSRAIRIVQTFETIEFVPLCQVLVAIQLVDSARQSTSEMQAVAELLREANPAMGALLEKFDDLWPIVDTAEPAEVARKIAAIGIDKELCSFLTTEPATLTAEQISDFMTPTYEHPISGQLYDKIGNILQGVAPFYLDTVLQLIDNLKNITPRVTPEELARWEAMHKNRILYIIGVVRKPEVILDVDTFDYTFLWQENFRKMVLIHRDRPAAQTDSIVMQIARRLRAKFENERAKYEQLLRNFDEVVDGKLAVRLAEELGDRIDRILLHGNMAMNNLWLYIMTTGYVVPFIDDAETGGAKADVYGTSLAYDETCEKLVHIRELLNDVGLKLG